MISDRALVLAAAATYQEKAVPIIEAIDQAVRVFRSDVDGLAVVAIEGTHDPVGWGLDFAAIPTEDHELATHPTLGMIHAGFYAAALSVFPRIALSVSGRDYAICGHSLGAALALLIGGLMIDDGHPPVKIGAFAPPRVGMQPFIDVVSTVPISAYRFGNDPVTQVPLTLPAIPYQQVPLIEVGDVMVDPISAHHVENYVEAIQ